MELTALAIFLITTPQALPNFTTIDGLSVSHAEGTAALRSGQAVLVGDLLVGPFASSAKPYPLSAAA